MSSTAARVPATHAPKSPQAPRLQRKCACGGKAGFEGTCEECRKERLQRKSNDAAGPDRVPPIVHEVLRSPGQPLDNETRSFMEPRLGRNFADVRVHADQPSAASACAVGALAYTVGREVVFDSGRYAPETAEGKRLLAHELTHVVQQTRRGAFHGHDHSAEREADRNAETVAAGGFATIGVAVPAQTIQRKPKAETRADVDQRVLKGLIEIVRKYPIDGEERVESLKRLMDSVPAEHARGLHGRLDPGAQSDAFPSYLKQQFPKTRAIALTTLAEKFGGPAATVKSSSPQAPIQLGAKPAVTSCSRESQPFANGTVLYFRENSAELTDSDQYKHLSDLFELAETAAKIEIHAHSNEGNNSDQSHALGCQRAAMIANVLGEVGAAVSIQLFTHDPTTVFGEAKFNRNVVVNITASGRAVSAEAQAFADLELILTQEIADVSSNLGNVRNRSKIFDADIEQIKKFIAWMNQTVKEGRQFVSDAEQTKGADRTTKFEAASARYEAVLITAQVTYLTTAFLVVADAAENAGVTSGAIGDALRAHAKQTDPILDSVVGFDRKKMAQAASTMSSKFQAERTGLQNWANSISSGAVWSKRVIAAADAILIVAQLYQAGRAISRPRGGPGATFNLQAIGPVAPGQTAAGISIKIPAEVLEGIRKLIQIGAISAPIVALGTGPTATLPATAGSTALFRSTPSGSVTPTKGPLAGTNQPHGDLRDKHTKVADKPLADIKSGIASRPSTPSPIKDLADAIRVQNKAYGSQLGKEATDQYAKLVQDALENGTQKSNTWFEHQATFEVGIDVKTGLATKKYQMFFSLNHGGWHLFPVSP